MLSPLVWQVCENSKKHTYKVHMKTRISLEVTKCYVKMNKRILIMYRFIDPVSL